MKHTLIPILGLILCQPVAVAQNDIPMLRPEERRAVDEQTDEFNRSLLPALTDAAKSTVRVWGGNRRLAYGTVIGDGRQVLTKWSEIARASAHLRVDRGDGEARAATVAGVYEDEDLALLDIEGSALTPVLWSHQTPKLGGFLAAPQPDGRPAAFGVVSVLERNLRDTDHAFLGVVGQLDFAGPGVKIQEVAGDSGAAAAGLRPGNVILKVNQRAISGMLELRNALVGIAPGTRVSLLVDTGGKQKTFDILLGNRPLLPNFMGERLRHMERMGGPISHVRDSFTRVIQSDMRPQPDQIGGPVVDLQGRVVGVTMARADRTRAFIMPAAAVENLLLKPAENPTLVQTRRRDEAAALSARNPGRQQAARDPERSRRHLLELERLMEHLQEEMDHLNR